MASLLGAVLIAASVAAIPAGQPPGVVFLLFVPGVILAAAFGASLPRVRRAYAEKIDVVDSGARLHRSATDAEGPG